MRALCTITLLLASCALPSIECPLPKAFGTTEIPESSGLVKSRAHANVYWTHNDRGGSSSLFAIRATGELVRRVKVEGANNVDWESLALDDENRIYIADIGNNDNARRDLEIYVLPEPDPFARGAAKVEGRFRFRYPDQTEFPDPKRMNFDAEAVFWANGRLHLLTKHRSDTRTILYRFPKLIRSGDVELEQIGQFDVGGADRPFGGMVTAADATPDGRYLAILTYHSIFIFERPASGNYFESSAKVIDFEQSVTQQCEAIVWDDNQLMFTNEQGQIHRIPAPLSPAMVRYPNRPQLAAAARP